jgi:hypothetical protein
MALESLRDGVSSIKLRKKFWIKSLVTTLKNRKQYFEYLNIIIRKGKSGDNGARYHYPQGGQTFRLKVGYQQIHKFEST